MSICLYERKMVDGREWGSLALESWLVNDSQWSRLAAQLQSKHACLLSRAQPRQLMQLATADVRTNTRQAFQTLQANKRVLFLLVVQPLTVRHLSSRFNLCHFIGKAQWLLVSQSICNFEALIDPQFSRYKVKTSTVALFLYTKYELISTRGMFCIGLATERFK